MLTGLFLFLWMHFISSFSLIFSFLISSFLSLSLFFLPYPPVPHNTTNSIPFMLVIPLALLNTWLFSLEIDLFLLSSWDILLEFWAISCKSESLESLAFSRLWVLKLFKRRAFSFLDSISCLLASADFSLWFFLSSWSLRLFCSSSSFWLLQLDKRTKSNPNLKRGVKDTRMLNKQQKQCSMRERIVKYFGFLLGNAWWLGFWGVFLIFFGFFHGFRLLFK